MASVSVRFEDDPRRVAVKLPLAERTRLLDVLQAGGIELAHECGGKLACATCRIVVRQGEETLEPAGIGELDMLDAAGALAPDARLACQAIVLGGDLVIEIPSSKALLPASSSADAALPSNRSTATRRPAVGCNSGEVSVPSVMLGWLAAACPGLGARRYSSQSPIVAPETRNVWTRPVSVATASARPVPSSASAAARAGRSWRTKSAPCCTSPHTCTRG